MNTFAQIGIILGAALVIKFFGRYIDVWVRHNSDHPDLRPDLRGDQLVYDVAAVLVVIGGLVWLFIF